MRQLEDLPGWANAVIGDLLSEVSRLDERIGQYDQHIYTIAKGSEAATQLMDHYPALAGRHPDVPWRSMRGMRNRIAHGYFDIDLDIVWETVRTALPSLLDCLPAVRKDACGGA